MSQPEINKEIGDSAHMAGQVYFFMIDNAVKYNDCAASSPVKAREHRHFAGRLQGKSLTSRRFFKDCWESDTEVQPGYTLEMYTGGKMSDDALYLWRVKAGEVVIVRIGFFRRSSMR